MKTIFPIRYKKSIGGPKRSRFAKDKAGHEHKPAGPGGGQFTSGGGSSDVNEAFKFVPTGRTDQKRILKTVTDEEFKSIGDRVKAYLEKNHSAVDVTDDEIDFLADMDSDGPSSSRPAAQRAFILIDKLKEKELVGTYLVKKDRENTGHKNRDYIASANRVRQIILGKYAKDASGHEHRGKGKGGGQFVTVPDGEGEGRTPEELGVKSRSPKKKSNPRREPSGVEQVGSGVIKVSVLRNPTLSDAVGRLHALKEKAEGDPFSSAELRGLTDGKNLWLWDASKLNHYDVAGYLGLDHDKLLSAGGHIRWKSEGPIELVFSRYKDTGSYLHDGEFVEQYAKLTRYKAADPFAAQATEHNIGDTKTENGQTYRLNENSRWERVDEQGNVIDEQSQEKPPEQADTPHPVVAQLLDKLKAHPDYQGKDVLTQEVPHEAAAVAYEFLKANAGKVAAGGHVVDFGGGKLGYASTKGAMIFEPTSGGMKVHFSDKTEMAGHNKPIQDDKGNPQAPVQATIPDHRPHREKADKARTALDEATGQWAQESGKGLDRHGHAAWRRHTSALRSQWRSHEAVASSLERQHKSRAAEIAKADKERERKSRPAKPVKEPKSPKQPEANKPADRTEDSPLFDSAKPGGEVPGSSKPKEYWNLSKPTRKAFDGVKSKLREHELDESNRQAIEHAILRGHINDSGDLTQVLATAKRLHNQGNTAEPDQAAVKEAVRRKAGREPVKSWTAIAKDKSAEWDMSPEDFQEVADQVWAEKSNHIEAKKQAGEALRMLTGLTQKDINSLENQGYDSGSSHPKTKSLDDIGRSIASQYPELGWGRGYEGDSDQDDTDYGELAWNLLREGEVKIPAKNSPEFMADIEEFLQHNLEGSSMTEAEREELAAVPFSRRGAAYRYTKDAAGHEHAPKGTSKGGQFTSSNWAAVGKSHIDNARKAHSILTSEFKQRFKELSIKPLRRQVDSAKSRVDSLNLLLASDNRVSVKTKLSDLESLRDFYIEKGMEALDKLNEAISHFEKQLDVSDYAASRNAAFDAQRVFQVVNSGVSFDQRIPDKYRKDASGHEHKGKGPGGGQFTETASGDVTEQPSKAKKPKKTAEEKEAEWGALMADKSPADQSVFDQARKDGIAIPPAWTDVIYYGKNENIWARGRDAKGRRQTAENPEYRQLLSDENNKRIAAELAPRIGELRHQLWKDAGGDRRALGEILDSLDGVTAKIEETQHEIRLEHLEVDSSQRRKGIGKQAMKEIVDYADRHGKVIRLTPDGSFGTPVESLRKFYSDFGFSDRGMPSGAMERLPDENRAGGDEEAKVLYLISMTGFRIGGKGDGKAKEQAFGASTLMGEHVKVEGDTVHFDFPGKKGVKQEHSITDPVISAIMRDAKPGKPVFKTRDSKVRAAWQNRYGGTKVHDIRHVVGTEAAQAELDKHIPPPPRNAKERKSVVKQAVAVAAAKLGNNPSQARDTYIDPGVWKPLQSQAVEQEFENPTARAAALGEIESSHEYPAYRSGIMRETKNKDRIEAVIEWAKKRGDQWNH